MQWGTPPLASVLLIGAVSVAGAQQWPQFRGTGTGQVPDDPALPDLWSETENIAWKIDIPGLSWASPIVWDDHIFVVTATSAADDDEGVCGHDDRVGAVRGGPGGRPQCI